VVKIKQMKIACISASQVPSGTANSIQAMKVCQSLAQAGHEVRLWLPGRSPCAWAELARTYGLTVRFEITWLPAIRQLRRYDFSWRAIRQAQAWGAHAAYTWVYQAALFAQWQGLPLLLELHDRPSGQGGPWLFRRIARHPGLKRLLFITHALQQALESEYHLNLGPEEIVIAPDGVDLERYQDLPTPEQARQQLGLPPGLTAAYTGHLYPGRGTDQLVKLARRFPHIHFLWVGGRPQDVDYWRVAVIGEKLDNIRMTGFVPNLDIPLYQAAGEILLMPYERVITGSSGGNTADICSPMKMFEYMAAGRAILSSDLPVLREVLDEHNAVLVPPPPEGAEAWAAALERLAALGELRARLSAQARRDVERYRWTERARRSLIHFP
jgi:glycosyltransferase involved in cell wall biosynthesis